MRFEKPGLDSVQRMSDDANSKGALLASVHRISPDLFTKNGFTNEDIDTYHHNLEKRLLKHPLTNKQHELRELAAESLRDTMLALHIQRPGFRDDFLEALDDVMRVDTHA